METLDLVILAAGSGSRTGEPVAKPFIELAGKPVLIHSLAVFEQLPYVGTKYVTVCRHSMEMVNDLLLRHQISNFELVQGGDTRQESVRLALEHVRTRRVITHNAAVPFVTPELIANVVRERHACVTTVTPIPYRLCRGGDFAMAMVPQEDLKMINTPQTFDTTIFRECHRMAHEQQRVFPSDCELMLHYGHRVRFVEGSVTNFKITTPLDIVLAKALAQGGMDQIGQL